MILIYLKSFITIQLILGVFVCVAIIIERGFPLTVEKNTALLRVFAKWEGNVYLITLVFGFFYLYSLIPGGNVPNPVMALLIIAFIFLMWPFHTGLDRLWEHFRDQSSGQNEINGTLISITSFSNLLKLYVIIIFVNFILSLFFLSQYNVFNLHFEYFYTTPFIFLGGDVLFIVFFNNLNKYWHGIGYMRQSETIMRSNAAFLNRQFYKKRIIPFLIALVLISAIIMLPYLFLTDNFKFIIFYILYIGLKFFIIGLFFTRIELY